MARSAVPCMFCGELPCVCKKKKALTQSKTKKRESKAENMVPKPTQLDTTPPAQYEADSQRIVPSLSAKEAMKRRAARKPVKDKSTHHPSLVEENAPVHAEPTVDEIEFNAAVKALESILHPVERRRYMKIIESETDYRVVAWKLKAKEENSGI